MSINITLDFYKPTGKWYSKHYLEVDTDHFFEAIKRVRELDRAGEIGMGEFHMVATADERHGGLSRMFTIEQRQEAK